MKDKKAEAEKARKPGASKRTYEKPGFTSSLVFERTSLACSGQKNLAGPPISNCTMQS